MNSIYIVAQFITYFRKVEKQRSRTTWVLWRELVEEIYREKYFQGKIKIDDYQDKEGNTRNSVCVMADEISLGPSNTVSQETKE